MAAFADGLWRLKREAGDPSYEEMSVHLGAAASKSSLAAAAQGRNLPSWETAWEFVRVLAVDRLGHAPQETEQEWRERWERAKEAGSATRAEAGTETRSESRDEAGAEPGDETADGARAPEEAGAVGEPSRAEVAEASETLETFVVDPPRPPRRDHRQIGWTGVAAATALAVGSGLVIYLLGVKSGSGDARAPSTPAGPVDPLERDDSRFEGDITYPDGLWCHRTPRSRRCGGFAIPERCIGTIAFWRG